MTALNVSMMAGGARRTVEHRFRICISKRKAIPVTPLGLFKPRFQHLGGRIC